MEPKLSKETSPSPWFTFFMVIPSFLRPLN
jgi:hypothetical protein